jgi:hypothetical protein
MRLAPVPADSEPSQRRASIAAVSGNISILVTAENGWSDEPQLHAATTVSLTLP